MKKSISVFIALLVSWSTYAQNIFSFQMKDSARPYIRILFAGDAMQHSPQFKWAWNPADHNYNYEPNFRYLRPYLAEADINVVNFETTLSGEPYSGYPRFSAPDAYFNELVSAGFQVFTLANNHILDGGKKGVVRTLEQLSSYPNLGAYLNPEERADKYPVIFEIDGMKIALFNATYGTNGLTPVPPHSVNYINMEQIRCDIENSLKDLSIDMRIMYIHWGDEYQLKHNKNQQRMGQQFADLGFDLIIGGHPHVVQDYEVLTASDGRRVPVVYSLGNLISNQRKIHTNGGIVAMVDIDRKTRELIKIHYVPVYVHKGSLMREQRNYYCIPTYDYLDGQLPFTLPNDSLEQDLRLFHNNVLNRIPATPVE